MDVNLIQFALNSGVKHIKLGWRKRICFVHLEGAKASSSGYGSNFAAAIDDALSRLPRTGIMAFALMFAVACGVEALPSVDARPKTKLVAQADLAEPVDMLAPRDLTPSPDLAPAPDLYVQCGRVGNPCCTDATCNGYWFVCGTEVPTGSGASICEPCGGHNEPCCDRPHPFGCSGGRSCLGNKLCG